MCACACAPPLAHRSCCRKKWLNGNAYVTIKLPTINRHDNFPDWLLMVLEVERGEVLLSDEPKFSQTRVYAYEAELLTRIA